jgi:hypothetical protein
MANYLSLPFCPGRQTKFIEHYDQSNHEWKKKIIKIVWSLVTLLSLELELADIMGKQTFLLSLSIVTDHIVHLLGQSNDYW